MPSEVRRDITLIGGSAGSITALRRVLHGLPKDYPAAIFIVVHIAPESPSFLHELVVRAGPLAAVRAEHGMPIVPGRIVVAPPDLHLFLSGDRVHLSRGPRENRHRPAIDVLFRSGAVTIGPRVTGVAMSGMLTARQGCGRSSSAAASPSCSIRRMRSSATCRATPCASSTWTMRYPRRTSPPAWRCWLASRSPCRRTPCRSRWRARTGWQAGRIRHGRARCARRTGSAHLPRMRRLAIGARGGRPGPSAVNE